MVVPLRLRPGNNKLGHSRRLWAWSVPAWRTCPGKSRACRRCYALRGFYAFGNSVDISLRRNLKASRRRDFVERMVAAIDRCGATIVRIHAAGDFYSARYAMCWLMIMMARPAVVFYFYTRSWRVPAIAAVLERMAPLPNVHVWYSVDRDTGLPAAVPAGVRLAYMLSSDDNAGVEVDTRRIDLYFRDKSFSRGRVVKSYNGRLVCPAEQGAGAKVTCDRCQICFVDPDEDTARRTHRTLSSDRQSPTRMALPLVTC